MGHVILARMGDPVVCGAFPAFPCIKELRPWLRHRVNRRASTWVRSSVLHGTRPLLTWEIPGPGNCTAEPGGLHIRIGQRVPARQGAGAAWRLLSRPVRRSLISGLSRLSRSQRARLRLLLLRTLVASDNPR
jgi:hypothetical protein